MNLAVIPARGGSKRIPRKNIRPFCGKPMIAWSIEAAFASKCFDMVLVSTDDEEICNVAKKYGASVPFIRPEPLSDDYTATGPVVSHAIRWLRDHGALPQYTCCLYPTAPFVRDEDIKTGLTKLQESKADFAMSVASFSFPIQRALWIDGGRVRMFDSDNFYSRSQDLEKSYHDAGQFYWGKTESWLNDSPIFLSDTVPVVLPRYRVQDIDTIEDWENAELMFKYLQVNEGR
ncbi:pseudaminic acid cytidylyltransferase [Methylophaga sp.]|uniref:pseudaminic acid cytidylyltransferase n=1 Tax=Methylophaga sp. TaxID=2024840 RepID=UPI003A8D4C22